MKTLLTMLGLGLTVALAGCSDGPGASPVDPGPQAAMGDKSRGPGGTPMNWFLNANREARWKQTVQNAYKLERALWMYTRDSGGELPALFHSVNRAGRRLLDYLPGGTLWNPFTGSREAPAWDHAHYAGQVGIVEIMDLDGCIAGYEISAFGAHTGHQLSIVFMGESPLCH